MFRAQRSWMALARWVGVVIIIAVLASAGLAIVVGSALAPSAPPIEAASQDDGPPTITVAAIALINADAGPFNSLTVSVQEQVSGSDVAAAVRTARQKAQSIEAALGRLGVPAATVRITNLSISGPPAGPRGPVMLTLQVDVAGTEQLLAAMEAALEAGAHSVNIYTKGPAHQAPPPDARASAAAVAEAIAQAQALARRSAEAAGLVLGEVRGVEVYAPSLGYGGPGPSGQWRIQVEVTYAVARAGQ